MTDKGLWGKISKRLKSLKVREKNKDIEGESSQICQALLRGGNSLERVKEKDARFDNL